MKKLQRKAHNTASLNIMATIIAHCWEMGNVRVIQTASAFRIGNICS